MTTDGLAAVHEAQARAERAAAEYKPIDYAAANRAFRRHKAALTRAKNSGDPRKVIDTVVATVREWNAADYPWPDSWSTWNVALQDAVTELEGWQAGMATHIDNIR